MTKVGTKGLIHGLVKQTQFCVSFIAPWCRNGSFQRTQSFQFLNRSLIWSSPMVILGDDWKKIVKRTNGRDGIFAKSSRCNTSWQRAQVWNPQSPGCQATSPNREIPAMLVRPCVQNAPRKEWRTKSFKFQSTPTESCSKFDQGPGGATTSPTLLGPVLVWSQQNYLRLLLIVRYFGSSWGCCLCDSPQWKPGHENE